MAVNELEQIMGLVNSEFLAGADAASQAESSTNNISIEGLDAGAAPPDVNQVADSKRNLLVESINQTTQQTTQPAGQRFIAKPPKNISEGNPMLRQLSGAPNFTSLDDFFSESNRQLSKSPFYETGIATPKWTPKKVYEKYDDQDYGYIRGIDLDDFYGKEEAWYETALKAAPRLSLSIINKVGEGLGYVGGLLSPYSWYQSISEDRNLFDVAADNGVVELFQYLDEEMKNEWLPTFQEAADRKKGFWARVATDGDFWADDVVDGVAFLASAWIPGMALSKIGTGAAMARGLSAAGRGLGIVGDVGANLDEAAAMTKWFANSGKAARRLDAFNSWALATASESMFEASHVRKDILNSPFYDDNGDPIINPQTGNVFTAEEKKKLAAQGAQNTFLMNSLLLGVTNVFEYRFFAKMMGAAAPAEGAAKYITGAAALGEEATLKAPTALWKTLATQIPAGAIREGFIEENMQLAIQRVNTEYGLQGKVAGMLDPDLWTKTAKQFSKQTVDALQGEDPEAALNIGLGGLIGGLFGSYTTQRGENKSYKNAQALMTAFNNSQNSWMKFGDVFQYNIVDSVDPDGNPIKTKQIALDKNGNPLYDYDKIFAITTGMKLNSDMFDDSLKQIGKYNQDLLRTRSWADFVVAHINAGMEDRLAEKLKQLETADPVALAKLGFLKDESFPQQLQKYKSIADQIVQQNKVLTDKIIFNNTSFFDKNNIPENNRRAHLVEIGARQVVHRETVKEITSDREALKSQLLTDDQTDLSDGIVDQLNELQYRIRSQEERIASAKKNGEDKLLPMSVYESVLQNLKNSYEELLKNNDLTVKELAKNPDGTYRYKKSSRNNPDLRDQIDSKTTVIGQIRNEIDNDSSLFTFFADQKNGAQNFGKFFNAVVAERTKIANEKAEAEKNKKAADKARAKARAEAEHKVVKEADGTFTIVDPSGVVVVENISSEAEANQKAQQLTADLLQKKADEIKAKEEEEKRKEKASQKQSTKKEPSLEDKKTLLAQKQQEAISLMDKGVKETEQRRKELIADGRTEDEALDITQNEWLQTEDGKKYSKLIAEIEALSSEIEQEESGANIPSLQDFLRQKYDSLSENPDFKNSYEEWYGSGAANGYIRDYNRKYNKNEKQVNVAGTKVETDEQFIDNLDLKDVTAKTLPAAMAAVRKAYQRIGSDPALLQKLIEKINQIEDDFSKTTLLQVVQTKQTSSSYIPLSTVGIDVPIQEHVVYDRINMPLNEYMLGFTLLGDSQVLEALSGATDDITDRVVAIATLEYINRNKQRLEGANIPNRTIITHETPKDIARLNKGMSVIAKASRIDGFNLQLFLKDGTASNIYVGGIGNYAIVHPDNTTEKIEWTEDQREFVKTNMLVNGEQMTDEQYDQLRDMYNKMQAFEQKVMPYLDEYLKISPNEDSMDVTSFFKETFTLSNNSKVGIQTGESFEDVVKKSADKLFTVQVADENDVVTEKNLPLLAFKRGTGWQFEFPLNAGERIVRVNENNEVESVTNFKKYIEEDLGLDIVMSDAFPGGYAWIGKSGSQRGYTPYKLDRTKGTETPALFKEYASAFRELKAAIEQGLASGTNEFKYRGETYSTLSALLKDFNIKHYGFYQYNGFVANLSYNPKSRGGGKFLIELRPQDITQRRALDANQKKALNMYISDSVLMGITDEMTDEEVTNQYAGWLKDLIKSYDKTIKNLKKSDDLTLQKIGNDLDSHLLFSYDLQNNKKSYKLQLVKKVEGVDAMPYFTYGASSIASKENDVRLTFNDNAPSISQRPPAASTTSSENVYDTLVDNRIGIDWDSVTYDTSAPGNIRRTNGTSTIIDYAGRKIVVINVNGRNIPFYLSTGSGGKVDVTSGKWYPVFGISESGWLNKLSGKEINNYYGSDILRGIAEALDKKIGDIRDDQSIPKVGVRGRHFDVINKDLNPTENETPTTRIVVEQNIKDTIDFLNSTGLGFQTAAPVSGIEAEKQKITPSEFKELVRLAKFFLENPNEPSVVGSVRGKYPELFKEITKIEERRKDELLGEQVLAEDENGNLVILPASQEDIDRVNAEYDAELDALEGAKPLSDTGSTPARTIEDDINPGDNDSPFMLDETEEAYEKYTESSFNEEVEWLKTALAGTGIRLEDLGTIINNLAAKKQVLGYYRDKAIYVNQALSGKGAVYHEAFHALFRDILTRSQRDFYLNKAKEAVGYITNQQVNEFRDDRGYFNKTDEEIRNLMYEEYLADGFRKWKLNKKQPKQSWFKNLIAKLDRIIGFFTKKSNDIEALYEQLDRGEFAGIKTEASTISQEGVYSVVYGRPKLYVKEGATNFTRDNTQILNLNLQNELIYKLTNLVGLQSQGTFTERFNNAIQEVKKDYDIETLIKNSTDPENLGNAIRLRYGNTFNDALYILGDSVEYALSDDLEGATDAMALRTPAGANANSLDQIRKAVQEKITTLGLEKGFDAENLEIPEDDEDIAEKQKGGEFDTIHMNPLHGLSREFRSLFSTIPYTYQDPQLGVTLKKMADGDMLFNAMIKISADLPIDQILPSLAKAVDMLEEDNDSSAVQLRAFANFVQKQFGIPDISDPTARPSKNIYLYKQFIDTFFITELSAKQVVLKTTKDGSKADIYDATINADVINKRDGVKYYYEQAYRRLNTPEAVAEFNKNFDNLRDYIVNSLFKNITNPKIVNARTKELNKVVDEMKQLLDAVNIVLPKNLIRQSFLAIYNLEKGLPFSPQSKQNRLDMEIDQRLMKQGAYLQSDFFLNIANIKNEDNYKNIFADTRDSSVEVGSDLGRIDGINAILKKAMRYVIKYDVNSAIPVFQNAEYKKVWRYSKYTPPILLAQMVRQYGISAITEMYPVLNEWYGDNPLFDGSAENELFLENLFIQSFGGFRQEIDDDAKAGVTFGNIDAKSLMVSNIVHFMNREKITKKMPGEKEAVSIVTYNRSRTQEESTTTNFLLAAKYQKLVDKDGKVSKVVVDNLVQMLRQEYNRIQREWSTRKDENVTRYQNYNENIHPETQLPIEGDSYVTKDGKVVNLRAYQFRNLEHFFDLQETNDENKNARLTLKDYLRNAAKNNISFDQILNQNAEDTTVKIGTLLEDQLEQYMNETFTDYLNALLKAQVVSLKENQITSDLLPTTIKQDFAEPKPIQDYGYNTLTDLLLDQHLNTFLNKMMVNQIFDGDIATGIKNATEYFKRNKSGVISGNSMKYGVFRTAIIQNLQEEINPDDLTEYTKKVTEDSKNKADIADGQSWHVMNHRIRMMDSWGRVDSEVRELLNAAKYRKLTKDEIETLEKKKVVLNSLKTATGGVLEYYKLSEHLINRLDVSHLVLQPGQTVEDAHRELDYLYSQIETLEDLVIADSSREDIADLEAKIEDLYKAVHLYWEPKRSRAKLHYLLNSMELSGIDQLFDTNASKKTTLVPVKLQENDITNLRSSKSNTRALFKFLQVETAGIHNHITLPTQARQLLTTYLGKLDTVAYNNKTIAQLAAEYSATLGEITKSNMQSLNARLLDENGDVNIVDLYKMMYEGLKKQGADTNTLKFFEIKNGAPVYNPNMPTIKKIFTYYYFAMFNDSVFSEQVSGRADILVSSYGYELLYDTETNEVITTAMQDENPNKYKSPRYRTRPLGVKVETINGRNVYTVEVVIPEPLARNESERALYLERLNKFFSTRIPTEDKRSMIVAEVVDYMDASYRNSIVVPQLIHILAGSDLDVDKLFSHTFAHYLDFNGQAHVYGDYSEFATPSQGRFIEYIHYMLNENRAIKDSLDAEIKNVSEKPVFTADFMKLKDELGISEMEYSADELKEKRKTLAIALDSLYKEKKELENRSKFFFEAHLANNDRFGSEGRARWQESLQEYEAAKANFELKKEEYDAIKREQELLDNTVRLAALVNVLKTMKMPTTQSALTTYIREKGNPVVTVLQNESLQQKIDILSNEDVFNNFYIKEKSSTKVFKDIAKSIGASVEDVINKNSIYSILADVVANDMNSSNKDGIGIAASFNKFLAFSEKNDVSLSYGFFGTVDQAGEKSIPTDFLNTDAIRNTGNSLGMFADASKDPIPSVLNLNPETVGTSNIIIGMSGNVQLGLLINKIPFIESVTDYVASNKSAAQTKQGQFDVKNVSSILKSSVIRDGIQYLSNENRLGELFERDKEGQIIFGAYRPMFVKMTDPKSDFVNLDKEKVLLSDLGINVEYEDGTVVLEDVAKIFIANVYVEAAKINSDILKLGKILNLIKAQRPDFNELDQVIANYDYFMSGASVFGDSIVKALSASKEYGPLIDAARKMSDYSKQLLIERSPLFKSINSILLTNFNNARDVKSRQKISDQITKLIIIQKAKIDIEKQIESLKGKQDETSVKMLEFYEGVAKYFKSDSWIENNTFMDDLDYLYYNNPGNPFVEFLKVNTRRNINYFEASTRMKLDKDIAENINNGFEALQKSPDVRTKRLARQLFYYTLVKDGLGFANNSFLSYLNPDMAEYKTISTYLDDFQDLLKQQQKFIDEQNKQILKIGKSGIKEEEKIARINEIADKVYKNYISLFDKFFESSTPGKTDWINLVVRKIFSGAGNQSFIRDYAGVAIQDKTFKQASQELVEAGVFSNIPADTKVGGNRFNFLIEAPSSVVVDFSSFVGKQDVNAIDNAVGNIFYPQIDMLLQFVGVDFPSLIKTSEGRLFKLMSVDNRSISQDIAYQSITGVYKGTSGVKAEYREIEIEGTKDLLNFGFTQADAIALYKHSQVKRISRQSEIDALIAMGVDPAEISDNVSAGSVKRQISQTQLPERMAREAEERRRAKEARQEATQFVEELPESMRLEAEARKKAKAQKAAQTGGVQFTEELPESMRLELEARKAKKAGQKVEPQQPTASDELASNTTSTRTVEYTPKGKEKQTYTIEGSKIFNKDGEEVFKQDSVDRNKIFANLAVKEGRATVVEYRGIKYIVNSKGVIISGATGKIMQWGPNNGDRIAITNLVMKTPAAAPAGTPMAKPGAITDADIAVLYNDKVTPLKAQNLPVPTIEDFSTRAKALINNLQKANMPKDQILEALKCL